MKLLMLKGLPGSGKSTWAKEYVAKVPGWVRVNKDTLREMMGSYRPGKDEALILLWRDEIIRQALLAGKNVLVDDTNFHLKHEARLRALLEICAVTRQTKGVFEELKFDTPLEECIKNDLKRPNSVGEKVIRKMYREYLAPKVFRAESDLALPTAIICDLDGTLCLHNGRSPYDAEKCGTDLINNPIDAIIRMAVARHWDVFFVSGREDKYRGITTEWLFNHHVPASGLFMRPTGDFREDSAVKQEIYEREIKGRYNVAFVLDDRNRVVDMWRRNGLTCLQVAEGDF